MDPLSTTASLIAIIQLSSRLYTLLSSFYLSATGAREQISALRGEIVGVQDVVCRVWDLVGLEDGEGEGEGEEDGEGDRDEKSLALGNHLDGALERAKQKERTDADSESIFKAAAPSTSTTPLRAPPRTSSLPALTALLFPTGTLSQLSNELNSLHIKLSAASPNNPIDASPGIARWKREKFKNMIKVLKWPFKKEEVEDMIGVIGRYKSTLVMALSVDNVALSVSANKTLMCLKGSLEIQADVEMKDKMVKWLAITDPSLNYHAGCRKAQIKTGEWVFKRDDFKTWMKRGPAWMWISGIPGCGKTILSSTIIRHLQNYCKSRPRHALAYFYFDFNTAAKQETSSCISSILAQLCSQIRNTPQHMAQAYKQCGNGNHQPSVNEMKEMLFKTLKMFDEAYIVIDALDECPKNSEREHLLALLSDIYQQRAENLHITVTSRREHDIEEVLLPLLTSPAIALQGIDVDTDIKSHVEYQLAADPVLKRWSKEIKLEMETALLKGAHGMFRWVACQLDSLKRCLKVSLIRKALQNLPKTLDDTYARLFLEIDEDYRQDAKNALVWLAFSSRPLLLSELAEAIVIDPKCAPSFDMENRFPDPKNVIQILGSFVTVLSHEESPQGIQPEGSNMRVMLAHFSVKEFLLSERIEQSTAKFFATSNLLAEAFLTNCCLLYTLQYVELAPKPASDEDFVKYPLLWYATTCWPLHVKQLCPQQYDEVDNLSLMKLITSKHPILNFFRLQYPSRSTPFFVGGSFCNSPLYLASSLGLTFLVQPILDKGWDVNEINYGDSTALHAAVENGHEDVARMLLEADADTAVIDHAGCTPLHRAIGTTESMVELLMVHGPYFQVSDHYGLTPLHSAVLQGNDSIVNLLLHGGAECDVKGSRLGQTPLHLAAWYNHTSQLEMLLKFGADINAKTTDGRTALHYAAGSNEKILPYLIANNADLEVQDDKGETALYWAAAHGECMAVEILIAAGAGTYSTLILLAKNGFHVGFHIVLDVAMTNRSTAEDAWNALRRVVADGHGICSGCRELLAGMAKTGP